MHELIVNLHMHTLYSDGSGTHTELAETGLKCNIDVLLVTDHNVYVQGVDRYYRNGKKRLLLLACEEIHDQDRDPQKNHMLIFGADRELAPLADDPQSLIDAARQSGGISFLAHPVDPALPAFGETDISWEDWDVHGFTGIELWNGFSELKAVAKSKLDGVFYAFFPEAIARGPLPKTLRIWNELHSKGERIVAIGGSDAHARKMSLGPLRKVIFPYGFHFSAINTHTLVPSTLTGDLKRDRKSVFDALAAGHCFVGYDLPGKTRGFRFSAQGKNQVAIMGDILPAGESVTFQAKTPFPSEIRLVKDGVVIKKTHGEALVHVTSDPGVYRVEAYKRYLGKMRGWIFSNPIYLK